MITVPAMPAMAAVCVVAGVCVVAAVVVAVRASSAGRCGGGLVMVVVRGCLRSRPAPVAAG